MKISPAVHPAFTLIDQKFLPIWDSHAFVYRHEKGSKVLSICTRDEHKTFGIIFPTPPTDNTGLPHILEHCVLCGSEKYPVKEPFKEMLKTSLQTFLNAFTYPDRTCYPVSSQNQQDFYHLMDVYLDAVFFPRLSPAVLGQEGWRFQWTDEAKLEYQGVVFNEMKGVYASPDSRLDEEVRQGLYPDTPYRFDYGGRPDHIPELSFDQFLKFHQDHYHAANAFACFYGNDDPAERLNRLHAVLERVPCGPVPEIPSLQILWPSPRTIDRTYPAQAGSDEGCFCQVNWLLAGESSDPQINLMVSLTASLLLNSPASPLRLALLDSGLGEDIIGGPLLYLRQPAFGAGLRGVDIGDEQAVTDCVIACLEEVAHNNFRPDLIEGLLNTTEFQMREMNTANKGLSAMLSALQPWIYGGDPLAALDPEPRMIELRKSLEQNPRLFADWIQENLLDNPSRLDVNLRPDPELGSHEAENEAKALATATQSFAADVEKASQAKALAQAVEHFQQTPDAPEATASLPKLRLHDIAGLPQPPPMHLNQVLGIPVSSTEVHSNRIVYIQLAFDFKHLTLEELALLPLYSRCLTELGAGKLDQLQFNEPVAMYSGGINVQFETSNTYRPGKTLAVMMLKSKCLASNLDPTLSLLADMLSDPLLGPADKIHQLLLEERSNEESELVQSGNQVVSLRLKAAHTAMERATEEMDGVCYLMRLREMEQLAPEDLRHRIQALHQKLVTRQNLRLHLGGDSESLSLTESKTTAFLSRLPEAQAVAAVDWPRLSLPGPEGLVATSPIQFVGLASPLDLSETGNHFSHFVAQRLINNDYLWERVRMQGGAYGSSCSYAHLDGLLVFSSFRDPHLDKTLDIYRGAGKWLSDLTFGKDDLEQAVIGTLGKMAPPEKPSSQVSKSFFRHLLGLEHAKREQFWQEILETTPAHLKAYGNAITQALQARESISVLGGEKALTKSKANLLLTRLM